MATNSVLPKTALTVGELVVDWISTSKGSGYIESSTFVKSLGGNSSNVAIGLRRLGTQSQILAKIGADIQGKYLVSVLEAERVCTEKVIVDSNNPTAQCYVFTSNDDDNTFLNWLGNAAQMLCSDEIQSDTINGVDIVHATGISLTSEPRRSAVLKTLKFAKEHNIAISFDAGFPTGEGEEAKDSVKTAMNCADIIKLNLLELLYWNKQTDPCNNDIPNDITSLYENPPSSGYEASTNNYKLEISKDLLTKLASNLYKKYSPQVLLVTLAAKGSFVFTNSNVLILPALKVDSVAGVGAGDAYMAGFIHKLVSESKNNSVLETLKNLDAHGLESIGSFASAVGALSTRSLSAHEALPTYSEVEKLVAN